MAVGVW